MLRLFVEFFFMMMMTTTHCKKPLKQAEDDEVVGQLEFHAEFSVRLPVLIIGHVVSGHVKQEKIGGAGKRRRKQNPEE
jgi:hypothetical protein